MDIDVTTVNDTVELAAKTTQKVVYATNFAIGFVAGSATTIAVIKVTRPKVVAFQERRAAKKAAKKNES